MNTRIFYTNRTKKRITVHNLAVLKIIKERQIFLCFTINVLQAQHGECQSNTLDGIYFLEGTGVNEAIIQLLLYRIC